MRSRPKTAVSHGPPLAHAQGYRMVSFCCPVIGLQVQECELHVNGVAERCDQDTGGEALRQG